MITFILYSNYLENDKILNYPPYSTIGHGYDMVKFVKIYKDIDLIIL